MQEPRTDQPAGRRRPWLTVVVNVLLVLVIIGLLVATWVPAFVGNRAPTSP